LGKFPPKYAALALTNFVERGLTSGDRDDIMDMYDLLKEEDLRLDNVEFRKFVIGSSGHRDTFYEL
jgi:hypothetical protein